ncbi:MAG: superoxide dismutase [Chlorobi bacterium]|nr:superoxide dismutase [Chlorobiota bacterium]
MAFTLPELQYAANSLEPSIDAKTMEIHHGKHHNAYVTNLNIAINGTPADLLSIEEICKNISSYPMVVRNNGGGHFNHSLFWTILSSNNGSISNELSSAIENDLGGMEKFKESFTTAATTRFGSGWAWLIVQEGGKLSVCSSPNQDNPIMDIAENKGIPILCLDVWEHAYYLNYQNRRPDYISSFWNIVNWTEVSSRFAEAIK